MKINDAVLGYIQIFLSLTFYCKNTKQTTTKKHYDHKFAIVVTHHYKMRILLKKSLLQLCTVIVIFRIHE